MRGDRVLITTDAVGGVWRYSLDLAQAVQKRGWTPILAVFGPHCSPAQRAEAAGVRLIETGAALDWTANAPPQLSASASLAARVAERTGCAVAHLHSPAFAAGFALPVVAVCHSCPRTWAEAMGASAKRETAPPAPEALDWRALALRRGMHAADVLLAPTQAFAAQVRRSYGLSRKLSVVRNGRTLPALGSERRQTFADHAFAAGRWWDAAKNAETLDAAARLCDTPIRLAGPWRGPNSSHTARREAVEALGPLLAGEVAAHLARRPIFIGAALYEPFGLAALEAAQHGCALVLSDIPTHRELWSNAAVFAPPQNPQRFAALVDALRRNPDARAAWGAAARRRSRAYSIERMAQRTIAAWRLAKRRHALKLRAAA